MELLQLKYFCDAAATQNFSRTAERFQVPPSNISQSIKRLEKELQTSLFTRSANRVELSKQGSSFYEDIKKALDLIEKAKEQAAAEVDVGELKLCIHINRRIVMQAVERFQSVFSSVDIITTHDMISVAEADLVIADGDLELPGFTKEKLLSENIVLAAKKGMFPEGVSLTAADIKDKPFISFHGGSSLHRITRRFCKTLGFQPRIALQSEDPFYIRKCVELGLGIALVPEFSWRGQFSEGVELRKAGEMTRDSFLYRRIQERPPRYIGEFIKMLSREIQNEMGQTGVAGGAYGKEE